MAHLEKIVTNPDSYFWFLWVLFFISILFTVAQILAQTIRINEMWAISLFCVVLAGIMVAFDVRLFGFQFIAYYFLFYTLGYVLHHHSHLKLSNSYLFMMACAWFAMAWFWTMHGLPSWMPHIPFIPAAAVQYVYRGLTATLAIIVLLNICPYILDGEGSLNNVLVSIGRLSLGMYVGHLMILGSIVSVIISLYPAMPAVIAILVSTTIATIAAYLLVLIAEKNRWTRELMLGKF